MTNVKIGLKDVIFRVKKRSLSKRIKENKKNWKGLAKYLEYLIVIMNRVDQYNEDK